MLKVFQIWFFRLKWLVNRMVRAEGKQRAAGIYGRFLPWLSFDRSVLDNLSEEAYAENDNDFDGDVYDNYTAKIF
jgi:hypothetical protein